MHTLKESLTCSIIGITAANAHPDAGLNSSILSPINQGQAKNPVLLAICDRFEANYSDQSG